MDLVTNRMGHDALRWGPEIVMQISHQRFAKHWGEGYWCNATDDPIMYYMSDGRGFWVLFLSKWKWWGKEVQAIVQGRPA